MKCLSLSPPWGHLVAAGLKNVENRLWPTKYRGVIGIHSAQRWDKYFLNLLGSRIKEFVPEDLQEAIREKTLVTSAIIGEVTIADCVRNFDSPWADHGQWNWVLTDGYLYPEPITNIKGHLSFWNYDIEKELKLRGIS